MQKTANYQLSQWEATDKLSREDFNSDNAAIDAAIKAVADGQATINQSVAALTTALGTGGQNCRIAWGTYIGNDKGGVSNPTKLTVDFYPVVVVVGRTTSPTSLYWPTILVRPMITGHNDTGSSSLVVSWSNTGVQWYSTAGDDYQNNSSNYTYVYVVLGYSV